MNTPGSPSTPRRDEAQHGRLERQQHPGAIAGRSIGGERAAVGEGPEACEGERQHAGPVPTPTQSATKPTPHASCSNRGS